MEGNSGNKKDGYESDSEYESALEDQEVVKGVAKNLMRRSNELSPQDQDIIGDFAAEVLGSTGMYQILSNQPIYDVPRNRNNASRNAPPPLPSSQPPSTLSRRHSSDSGISSGAESGFQQCFDSGLRRLGSGSINESEMSDAIDRAAETVSSSEVQEQLENKIKSDPSFLKKMQEKWNSLDNKDKALFVLSKSEKAAGKVFGAALLLSLLPVIAVVGLAVAIIGGLKLATPSKAEFKKTGQEIMHSIKNAANVLPRETNLEKLWKSTHKPGVTSENPNLEEFLTKYCFPDQESGKKAEVKFDPDKIEALKATVKTVGLDLDQSIDRVVEKGDSIFRSDYVKTNKDGIDTQFIQTINDVVTKVMAKDHRIEDKFKDKLTEVKQAKEEEKAAEKKGSFASKFSFSKQSSSHAESVETGRRESNGSQGRST
ncbi:MAG: hypothetical protein U0X86_000832 [Wolbachia endosymbiont of Xenopsylla cheopis]